jgi:hypothetical protein
MNNNLPELTNDQQGQSSPDSARRRLLRAAASAAPLVATLPSGAALATASTYQCILDDKDASDGLTKNRGGDFVTSLDHWARVPAKRTVWTKTENSTTTTVRAYRFSETGPWYKQGDGTEFDPAGYTPSKTEDVYVLQLYQPNATDPTGLVACQTQGPASLPNGGCIYPVAKRDTADLGNMGVRGSCLCSITDCKA